MPSHNKHLKIYLLSLVLQVRVVDGGCLIEGTLFRCPKFLGILTLDSFIHSVQLVLTSFILYRII